MRIFFPIYWVKKNELAYEAIAVAPRESHGGAENQSSNTGSASKPTYPATTAQPSQSTIMQIFPRCNPIQQVYLGKQHQLTLVETEHIIFSSSSKGIITLTLTPHWQCSIKGRD